MPWVHHYVCMISVPSFIEKKKKKKKKKEYVHYLFIGVSRASNGVYKLVMEDKNYASGCYQTRNIIIYNLIIMIISCVCFFYYYCYYYYYCYFIQLS